MYPHLNENQLQFVPVNRTPGGWDALIAASREWFHPASSSIELLRSGLDPHVQMVVIEPAYICKDHRNLHSFFYSKKFRDRPSNCHRFHFFTGPVSEDTLINYPLEAQRSYLGYCVVRPVPMYEIGRTIIDGKKLAMSHDQGYYYLRTTFRVNLNGVNLHVTGFPFMMQDNEATVCAHAALWGVCRYLSQRYPQYGEFQPFDLILRNSTTRGRLLPQRGMTHEDYARILTEFGCHPVTFPPMSEDTSKATFRDLCAYIESGIPLVTSLKRDGTEFGHVVNLIGHRSDPHRHPGKNFVQSLPVPQGSVDLIDSSAYIDRFIVMDDNLFPYRELGLRGGDNDPKYAQKGYTLDTIRTAVAPLPDKVYLGAPAVRVLAYEILTEMAKEEKTLSELIWLGPNRRLVMRLYLTSSRSFKTKKLDNYRKYRDDELLRFPTQLNLPHFIWVIELSREEAYFSKTPNERCFAEIVLDATSNEIDRSPIYARIANLILEQSTWKESSGSPLTFVPYYHNLGQPSA